MRRMMVAVPAAIGIFGIAQFFQPERANPPSDPQASFEAVAHPPPEVTAVLQRACRDCHSNRTVWPWYSRIAPASWLVASDVAEGRGKLNFSRWDIYGPEMSQSRLRAVCGAMRSGEMPPWYYRPLHPEAKVTAEDIAAVCAAAEGGKTGR